MQALPRRAGICATLSRPGVWRRPVVEADPEAKEIVRAFVSHNQLHIAHLIDVWPSPETWGIVLADLTRHIAAAAVEVSGENPLEKIVEVFNSEITNPTDEINGTIEYQQ